MVYQCKNCGKKFADKKDYHKHTCKKTKAFDIVCVSPWNHYMVFTLLLASTCVGTCTGIIDTSEHGVYCEAVENVGQSGVKDPIKFTLTEANEILSSSVGLRDYAANHLQKSGVCLLRGILEVVEKEKIVLTDGTEVPYGILVWSTGVGPSEFVKSLNLPKGRGGRVGIDQWLRVPSVEDVFVVGDCAGFVEQTGMNVLPALAQVAEREGKYLVELFYDMAKQTVGKAYAAKDVALGEPFVYKCSMASVGSFS